MSQFLNKIDNYRLTGEQRTAVFHYRGPLLVGAGAGSGKTTVLTLRVACLISEYKVPAEKILVLTYTKKCAEEMRVRAAAIEPEVKNVRFGTFHSFCYEWLHREKSIEGFRVLEDSYRERLVIEKVMKEGGYREEEARVKLKVFFKVYSKINNIYGTWKLPPEVYENKNNEHLISIDPLSPEEYSLFSEIYKREKRLASYLDFEDMQSMLLAKLNNDYSFKKKAEAAYDFFLVDEFQDINPVQYSILKEISLNKGNVFCVGDEDQCIYGFRGADPGIMLHFPDEFRKKNGERADYILLKNNFRSRAEISYLATELIAYNKKRFEKNIIPALPGGAYIRLLNSENQKSEASQIRDIIISAYKQLRIPFRDMAVLVRTNNQTAAIENALKDADIPFSSDNGGDSVFEHFICKDFEMFARLAEEYCGAAGADAASYDDLSGLIRRSALIFAVPVFMLDEAEYACGLNGSIVNFIDKLENIDDVPVRALAAVRNYTAFIRRISAAEFSDKFVLLTMNSEYSYYLKEYCAKNSFEPRKLNAVKKKLYESMEKFKDLNTWLSERKTESEAGVNIETIHAAKGLEYRLVAVAGVGSSYIPHPDNPDLEEERRLFYVALTRAKEYLFMSQIKVRNSEDSLFIKNLNEINSKRHFFGTL